MISCGAIAENWRTIAQLAKRAQAGAAIKADAYGHGLVPIALALARAGCQDFFVASLAEGQAARAALGPGPRIWVLNGLEGQPAAQRAAGLQPVLNTLEDVAMWGNLGPFALHLDTGMNRLGLAPADWAEAAHLVSQHAPALVMSHLACADDSSSPMNARQLAQFAEGAARFPGAQTSLAASAGLALGPDYHHDLVRPGLALFGHWGSDQPMPRLAPAMSASAPILQIRKVEAGQSVGYGASYVCKKPAILATIAMGYADGFLRSMSNRGYGALDGVICPIRGRVSMDLTILDVTAAGARARVGAMVEILGQNLNAVELAALGATIPYEVLTSLGAAAASSQTRIIA
jgi:alanine racemase